MGLQVFSQNNGKAIVIIIIIILPHSGKTVTHEHRQRGYGGELLALHNDFQSGDHLEHIMSQGHCHHCHWQHGIPRFWISNFVHRHWASTWIHVVGIVNCAVELARQPWNHSLRRNYGVDKPWFFVVDRPLEINGTTIHQRMV